MRTQPAPPRSRASPVIALHVEARRLVCLSLHAANIVVCIHAVLCQQDGLARGVPMPSKKSPKRATSSPGRPRVKRWSRMASSCHLVVESIDIGKRRNDKNVGHFWHGPRRR